MLYRGGLDDALALTGLEGFQRGPGHDEVPDLWWPANRAWFVGSDTDLTCTYLGGPHKLVARLLATPELETQAVAPEDLLA